MYGLEKGKKEPKKFDFDLEREIKNNPTKKKKLVDEAASSLHELKAEIKKTSNQDSKAMIKIADAYEALKKVIKKIV